MKSILFVGLFLTVFVVSAQSAPIEIVARETHRQHKLTGTITLREPITNRVLGVYEFVSGGFGRGSAPWGKYEIGAFRDDGWIGPRWEVHQIGVDPRDGDSAWDPRVGAMRTWIQIHTMHGFGHLRGTLGCFGVYGGPEVWAKFQGQMRFLLAWFGVLQFDFEPMQAIALMDRG